MSELENRAAQVLRDTQRQADEGARLAMREAARMLELSSQLEQMERDISDFDVGYLSALMDVAAVLDATHSRSNTMTESK